MAKISEREKEERLAEKLVKGEKIASTEEMTEEYRENLKHLMMMQADSELAGAFGYVPWITIPAANCSGSTSFPGERTANLRCVHDRLISS